MTITYIITPIRSFHRQPTALISEISRLSLRSLQWLKDEETTNAWHVCWNVIPMVLSSNVKVIRTLIINKYIYIYIQIRIHIQMLYNHIWVWNNIQFILLYYTICLYDCLCTSVPVVQNAYHGGIGCGRVTVSISEFFHETLERSWVLKLPVASGTHLI